MNTFWTATALVLVAAGAGTAGFVAGTLYGENPPRIEASIVDAPPPEEPHLCPPPVTCPPPGRHCKSLHDRAVLAIGETLLADSYVQGAEDAHDSAEICESALKERWPPEKGSCSACRYWDRELDLMGLGVRVMALDVETSNWHRACEELYRVWPTEPEEPGRYPADFPRFCQ